MKLLVQRRDDYVVVRVWEELYSIKTSNSGNSRSKNYSRFVKEIRNKMESILGKVYLVISFYY